LSLSGVRRKEKSDNGILNQEEITIESGTYNHLGVSDHFSV
jgi:hypothetical protein